MRLLEQHSIRILHVLYAMNTGGIETWLMQILRHTDRERLQMDFLVHVIYPCAYTEEIRALGSQIILCPHPRQYVRQPWQYDRTFKQLLRQHGSYHIIHAHTAHFNGYVLRLARQAGIPVRIAHSHNDSFYADARDPLHRRLYIAFTKSLISRYATMGLAASDRAAAYLFGGNWQSDRRWQVLYCSLDLTPFRQQIDPVAVRAEFNIPEDAFVIGHVGRFVEQKNPLFLIEIVAEVAKLEPKTYLLLVGNGSLQSEMEAKVQQVGLSDRVIFAGIRSDVPRLMLGAMDVFLFPSLYEGLGLVLIEAQAAGLPCVLSDIVPEEADLIESLMHRMSLSLSASAWAQAVVAARSNQCAIARSDALAIVENSPFNIDIGVKKLVKVYESKVSIC
jgi:glycosyltransferase involved in cell wall biosynthesis